MASFIVRDGIFAMPICSMQIYAYAIGLRREKQSLAFVAVIIRLDCFAGQWYKSQCIPPKRSFIMQTAKLFKNGRMPTLNLEQFSTRLRQLNFNLLFTDVLGWNHPPAGERTWQDDEAKDIRYRRRMITLVFLLRRFATQCVANCFGRIIIVS